MIGVVVADTHEHAVYAARKVKIDYEDVLPIAVSIEDAIKHNSYYSDHHELRSGDIEVARESAEIHVTGERKIGAQEHFYLETNCTIVIPSENGELEIYSSTQNPTKTQNFCASVCGISASKVVSKCKRMGGGFGGKETRSVFIACTAALASYLLNRPVSINIERDVDMSISGQRHSFIGKYSAGCTKDGIIKYVQYQLYSNAGYSLDLSQPVMDRALFHCDNVYEFPALHCRGSICKTNQPSHTAFRGFGGPQGLIMAEMVMDHLASATGIPVDILRRRNMYKEGSITHFGMPLEDFNVPMMWDQLYNTANIAQRRNEVEKFNAENRWRKRGISIVPTKFGISFTAKFMNQVDKSMNVL